MTPADIGRSLGISPESTIVSGYSGYSRTLAALADRWTWAILHTEMQRRHLAMYFSHPGTELERIDANGLPILVSTMGVGSAGRQAGEAARLNFWSRNSRTYLAGRPSRSTPEGRAWLLPGKSPIAYPGTSNHEADTFEDQGMAVDNVGWADGWMGENVARFGLKTFWNVGNEPHHTQPAGYGNPKSALQADLARMGLPVIDLPAIPLASTPPPDPEEDDMPAPYLQVPPETREGSAWFYCANGAKSLATALDVYETPADRHQRDLDMTPSATTGIPAAVERYDLLHESVLGRRPA